MRYKRSLSNGKRYCRAVYYENQTKLAHFHIHDSMGNQTHMTLGEGTLYIVGKLALADSVKASAVIEVKTVEGLKKSCDWLSINTDLFNR